MSDWKKSICAEPTTESVNAIQNFVSSRPVSSLSPIDNYYRYQQDVLSLTTPQFLGGNSSISSVFVIALVSNTEYYLRNVLAKCIQLCPMTRSNSGQKKLNLSSIYFGSDFMERGVFEDNSLSDKKVIKTLLRTVPGFSDIHIRNQFDAILNEFQKVCELRHGAAHSINVLPSKNAVKLGLSPQRNDYILELSNQNVQDIAAVCTSLVRTVNTELYLLYVERWADKWRDVSVPIDCNHSTFKQIWNIFYSRVDEDSNSITSTMTMMKAKNAIKREYNI